MTPTVEQVAKLPKWARDLIYDRDCTIRALQEALDAEPDIVTNPRHRLAPGVYQRLTLSNSFRRLDGNSRYCSIVVMPEGGWDESLEVSTRPTPSKDATELHVSAYSSRLHVLPMASNAIRVEVQRR